MSTELVHHWPDDVPVPPLLVIVLSIYHHGSSYTCSHRRSRRRPWLLLLLPERRRRPLLLVWYKDAIGPIHTQSRLAKLIPRSNSSQQKVSETCCKGFHTIIDLLQNCTWSTIGNFVESNDYCHSVAEWERPFAATFANGIGRPQHKLIIRAKSSLTTKHAPKYSLSIWQNAIQDAAI